LGFRVAVGDDRPEFCSHESIPEADDFYLGNMDELLDQIKFTPNTYFILTTRSVDLDVQLLPKLLENNLAYIGVIGSRRRWATTCQQLQDAGVPNEKIEAVHSPIGLNLKAETPREIAVSILAEIMMVQKHGNSRPMSEN
jgi:xanthine dehydrogenase accessory factor